MLCDVVVVCPHIFSHPTQPLSPPSITITDAKIFLQRFSMLQDGMFLLMKSKFANTIRRDQDS